MRLAAPTLHFLAELSHADHRPPDGSAPDFTHFVARGDAQGVEAAIERLEHSLGCDAGTDAAGGAMFNVDGCAHGNLVAFTVRLQRMKCRCLHQPDHIRGRIYRGLLRMVLSERVLELNGLLRLAARTQWDIVSHAWPQEDLGITSLWR